MYIFDFEVKKLFVSRILSDRHDGQIGIGNEFIYVTFSSSFYTFLKRLKSF